MVELEVLLEQIDLGKAAKDLLANKAYMAAAMNIQHDTLNVITTSDNDNVVGREAACQKLRGIDAIHQQIVQMVSAGEQAEKALDNEDAE